MVATQSKGKIESIAMLRGMAIMCIVYEHAAFVLWDNGFYAGGMLNFLFEQFIPRWTAIFVFISGFLYYHLAYRYETKKYYLTKVKNVIIPYLIVSAVSYLYFAHTQLMTLNFGFTDLSHNVFFWIIKNLVLGTINTPLWFIPMITIIFILGPLLYRLSRENMVLVAIGAIIFVNFYHRPPYTSGPILNVIFFLPYYLVGMCVCQHKDWIINQCWKHFPIIIGLSIFTFVVSLLKYIKFSVYPWIDYDDNLQIFLLGMIFFVLFEKVRIPKLTQRVLIHVGETSFAIFFIHYIFIHFMAHFIIDHANLFPGIAHTNSGVVSFLTYSIIFLISLMLCHYIALGMKRVLGRYSRYLIGY